MLEGNKCSREKTMKSQGNQEYQSKSSVVTGCHISLKGKVRYKQIFESLPACNVGDLGSVPESGRSPGEGNGNHSSILAWKILWTEEPGWPQSMSQKKLDMTEQLTLYWTWRSHPRRSFEEILYGVGVEDHLHLRLDLRWLDEKVNLSERLVMITSSTWGRYIWVRAPWQSFSDLSISELENLSLRPALYLRS